MGKTIESIILHLFAPRYWPTWLAIGSLRLLSCLPFKIQLILGRRLGALMIRASERRRRIAAVNLALCFPDKTDDARDALLHAHFRSLGMGFIETGLSWWKSDAWIKRHLEIRGFEHLEQARAAGKGVLLIAAHFTTLEIGGRLLATQAPMSLVYRPHSNAAFEHVQNHARARHSAGAIRRSDMRAMIRTLRDGGCVWYAPDQDYGRARSTFAEFFGIQTATLTATTRIAGITGAAVVPMTQERLDDGRGYRLILEPALQHFPGADTQSDARRINQIIERWARARPADYLWVHRRFKTRPAGEPSFYE